MLKIFIFQNLLPWGGGIDRWVGTIDHMVIKISLEHDLTHLKTPYIMFLMLKIFIFQKYPTLGGGIGWGIDRWVGTIDHMVLKMSLEHETTH